MENLFLKLFPTCCVLCGKLGPMICVKCSFLCEVVYEPICILCGEEALDGFTHESCLVSTSPTQLHTCFVHFRETKKCIELSKYAPFEYGAIQELAKYGIQHALDVGDYLFDFVVVPVPLSRKVLRKRGFNQAKLISDVVSVALDLFSDTGLLFKGEEVFIANPERCVEGKFLLVDDIYKTGKTLRDCSKALYAAGAAEVRCFTLSRVV